MSLEVFFADSVPKQRCSRMNSDDDDAIFLHGVDSPPLFSSSSPALPDLDKIYPSNQVNCSLPLTLSQLSNPVHIDLSPPLQLSQFEVNSSFNNHTEEVSHLSVTPVIHQQEEDSDMLSLPDNTDVVSNDSMLTFLQDEFFQDILTQKNDNATDMRDRHTSDFSLSSSLSASIKDQGLTYTAQEILKNTE